ncbi:DUF881 domain-containing protein [Cellulosimicrobium cellulans]|uniref:DUF881 domain-containing protein n=1 Tax=Cellulosimicrobium cellulans TaxID=1710 RepID=UPI0036EA0E07
MSVTRDPQDPRDPSPDDVTPDAAAPDAAALTTDETTDETTDAVETARPPALEDVEAVPDVAAEPETRGETAAPHATTGEAAADAPDETGADDEPAEQPAREHDVAPEVPDSAVGGDEPPAADPTPVGEEPGLDPAGAGPRDGTDQHHDHEDEDEDGGTAAPDDPAGGAAAPDDDAAATETASTDASTPTEPPATTGTIGAVGRHGSPTRPEPRGLRGLGRALRPRASRSQIVVGVLCALLGFALVVQVSQTQEDQLSSLRQSDLVRLLDDVTQRSGELEDQVSSLESTRDELQSGSGRERAALELAEQQAETLGILSGRLPAEGPGVEIEVVEGAEALDAFALFNVLEELRNAGAEAMEVNGVRLVASSYFEDSAEGVVVDGQTITSPYRWNVIGDPSTLETALEIPGGAMASLRADGARTTITQQDRVEVTATVEPGAPQYATPVPADE